MKRQANKIICLLLSLTMILNMLPLTVWATAMESPDGWLYEVNEDGIALITGYTGTFENGEVEIPERLDGHTVRIINDDALSYRTDVVTVTMTNNIDYIFGGAFKYCENLEEIKISSKLRVLDNVAFEGCTGLKSLELPDSLERIGGNVFRGCDNLEQITFEGSQAQWNRMAGNAGLPAGVEVICTGSDEGLSDDEGWQYYIEEEENRDGIYRYAVLSGNENPVSGDIVIPGSREIDGLDVEAIGAEVFVNNHDLTSVEITEPVRSLFGMAFSSCSNLESVTLPESLRRINGRVFENCSSLTEIDMSDTEVEFIGEYAFENCTSLENIIFSPDIEEIDEGAFENCTSLTSLVIPESLNEIGENAFRGCENLQQITYEGTRAQWDRMIENAGLSADVEVTCTGKEGWVLEVDEEEITIVAYNGIFTNDCLEFNNGVLTIPDSFEVDGETYPVLWLGTDSLMEHEEIIEVIVPDTVRGLGGGAFSNCVNLEKVTLSDNLRQINSNAFRKCESLISIQLPESLQYIGSRAFERSGLTTITYHGTQFQWNRLEIDEGAIPENVTVNCIGEVGWVYEVNEDDEILLRGYSDEFANGIVNIPAQIEGKDVLFIEPDSFRDRADVAQVTLPDTLRRISNRSFLGCFNLTSINIPDSVYYIGRQALMDCKSLTAITLPTSIEEIDENAFDGCDNLTITYLGTQTQWDRIEKGENAIPENVTVNCIGQSGWIFGLSDEGEMGHAVLFGHTDPLIGEVTLPETDNEGRPVRVIAGEAFAEQNGLTKLIIPDCYRNINPNSFRGCSSLTEIKLPLELHAIGVFAFEGCSNLTKVIYPGREDQWDEVEVPDNAFMPHDIDELIIFGDDGIYEVTGTVKTSDGTPIEGATVTLTREDGTVETVTTLDDGIYLFEDLYYESVYQLSAAADGYPTRTVSIQLDADSVYDIIFYTAAEYASNINLAYLRENEIGDFNPGIADGDSLSVLANTLEGLTAIGKNGNVLPALAESWSHNSDYTQWTFNIRDNVKWVDINGVEKGTVTACDFATTLEWRLNSKKNPEHHAGFIFHEFIVGALKYTDDTDRMNESVAWNLTATSNEFLDTVGISIDEDGNSITFNLTKPTSYFPTIVAGSHFAGLHPMSESMIAEIGLHNVNDMDNNNMWYCGPYVLKEFVRGNYKVYEPNPLYWDLIDGNTDDFHLFERVVVTMVGDYQDAYRLFEAGQLDYVEIDGDIANDIIASGSEYADNLVSKVLRQYSYQMHWNYNKFDETRPVLDENGEQMYDRYSKPLYESDTNWNIAIANEDFRLSLYYGWELSNYYARTNPVDPLLVEHNTNTMKDVVYTSDGNDYTELVKERLGLGIYNGETMVRMNQSKAEQHKEAARTALLEQGVTFPIEIDYYVKEDMPESQETLAILRNCLTQSLGEDYVTINICTYEDSHSKEVRDPQFQSISINGWGMDYRDPYNNLFQFALDDNSYYSDMFNNIIDLLNGTPDYATEVVGQFRTYASILEEAEQYTGDVRLNKLADAEAYLISHGLVTPCFIDSGYCLGYIKPESKDSSSMKYWELSDTLISGGEIHDNGIVDMGVWKPKNNQDHVFDWILTKEGTLYITGNGSLEGLGNYSNYPWHQYKNNITKIVISAGVTGLNETGAFKELEKVAEIEFGEYTEAVTSSTYRLRAVPGIQTRTYSKMETIGEYVFAGCTSLTSVVLPEGVVTIGDNVFNGCISLSSIDLPSTIESIGANAFDNTALTTINYNGTMEDWSNIAIDSSNVFANMEIVCLDGTINQGGTATNKETLDLFGTHANLTVPTDLVYNGDYQSLVIWDYYYGTEPIHFKVNGVLANPVDNPLGKEAGTYTVTYWVPESEQFYAVPETTITVTIAAPANTPLEIITQPTDAHAYLGDTYCTTIEAVGDELKYQWYFRNAGSDVWNKSSVRDNTYDDIMTTSRNGRDVYCVVSDKWGNSMTSDIAKLIAEPKETLAIVNQPIEQFAKLGEMFNAEVTAVGDELKYQWYFIDKNSETVRKSGQRDNTYDDLMSTSRSGRTVYCVITDAWGNSVTSEAVTLNCEKSTDVEITVQPKTQTVKVGEEFCVEVAAVGDGLKYQWYYRNVGSEDWVTSGQRDNTYDDVMTKARHNREVYCKISDMWGNEVISNTATLIAEQSQTLAITGQPVNQFAKLGEMFCPTVEAVGDELQYQWYFIDKNSSTVRKSGQRDTSYDDVMTTARNGREVYCVVTDMWGNTLESDHVFLNGVPETELTITAQPQSSIVPMGDRYCVTVEAVGDELQYQWYFRNKGSDIWSRSSVRDNTYDDIMTTSRDGREVCCLITDALGNTKTTEPVTISAKKAA